MLDDKLVIVMKSTAITGLSLPNPAWLRAEAHLHALRVEREAYVMTFNYGQTLLAVTDFRNFLSGDLAPEPDLAQYYLARGKEHGRSLFVGLRLLLCELYREIIAPGLHEAPL